MNEFVPRAPRFRVCSPFTRCCKLLYMYSDQTCQSRNVAMEAGVTQIMITCKLQRSTIANSNEQSGLLGSGGADMHTNRCCRYELRTGAGFFGTIESGRMRKSRSNLSVPACALYDTLNARDRDAANRLIWSLASCQHNEHIPRMSTNFETSAIEVQG